MAPRKRERAPCSEPGCGRPSKGRGLCNAHYQRLKQQGGYPGCVPCKEPECAGAAWSRGLCHAHYRALKATGAFGAICSVDGCTRGAQGCGLCSTHYSRALADGAIVRGVCEDEDCQGPVRARGLCSKHLTRAIKGGLYGVACAVSGCDGYSASPKGGPCHVCRHKMGIYGLTLEQLAELIANDTCQICGEPATVIDHCHSTGNVRGYLCSSCNFTLGTAKDSPEILRAAAAYLERSRSSSIVVQ